MAAHTGAVGAVPGSALTARSNNSLVNERFCSRASTKGWPSLPNPCPNAGPDGIEPAASLAVEVARSPATRSCGWRFARPGPRAQFGPAFLLRRGTSHVPVAASRKTAALVCCVCNRDCAADGRKSVLGGAIAERAPVLLAAARGLVVSPVDSGGFGNGLRLGDGHMLAAGARGARGDQRSSDQEHAARQQRVPEPGCQRCGV